jgi:hypothetical protein
LSSAHWQHALICAQFAAAVYGGGQSPAGEKQPQVRELDPANISNGGDQPHSAIPEMASDKDFLQLVDVDQELKASTVLKSEMITHYETDTEVWICLYETPVEQQRKLVVAFRGTSSAADLKSNFLPLLKRWNVVREIEKLARWEASQKSSQEFSSTELSGLAAVSQEFSSTEFQRIEIHPGYFRQYDSVADCVEERVQQTVEMCRADGSESRLQIFIVGHSMGGALARLCTFDLLARGIAKKEQTWLCTLGSILAGNRAFAEALDELLGVDDDCSRNLHIVNKNDPVPAAGLRSNEGGCCCLGRCFFLPCRLRKLFCRCHAYDGKYIDEFPEHSGTLTWVTNQRTHTVTNQFLALEAISGTARKWRRLYAYACCLCPCNAIRFPFSDHLVGNYVQSIKGFRDLMQAQQGHSNSAAPEQAEGREVYPKTTGNVYDGETLNVVGSKRLDEQANDINLVSIPGVLESHDTSPAA